jgi:signal transduction histidine kinase
VQGILRAHGGGIRLESSPNRGTRVELLFPAYTSTAQPVSTTHVLV